MKRRSALWALGGAGLALWGWLTWGVGWGMQTPPPAQPVLRAPVAPSASVPSPLLADLIALTSPPATVSTGDLRRLTERLRAGNAREVAADLIRFLERGQDAVTGQRFRVGPEGTLQGWSTLRVWALDQLGVLAPAEAAGYAEQVFARSGSADEWALALRHVWRGHRDPYATTRARVLELLQKPGWSKRPSDGFLEALDFTAATLAWEAIPILEGWLGGGAAPELRKGAWVALDRLVQEGPDEVLTALAGRADWLGTQSNLRAGLLARADVRRPAQRTAVEDYLLRPTLSSAEAARFFDLFPNVSGALSWSLATVPRPITAAEAADRDRASNRLLQAWQARPEFARWTEDVNRASRRLGAHIAAADRAGL
jgi:hypothetical protein